MKVHNFEFFNNLPFLRFYRFPVSSFALLPLPFPPQSRPPTHSARPSTLTSSALTGYDS